MIILKKWYNVKQSVCDVHNYFLIPVLILGKESTFFDVVYITFLDSIQCYFPVPIIPDIESGYWTAHKNDFVVPVIISERKLAAFGAH